MMEPLIKKIVFRILFPALMSFAILPYTGCTRNNGDIGMWFSTWHMISVAADGDADTAYKKDIFWSFQNDILQLMRIQTGNDGMHRVERRYGTWHEGKCSIIVNFSYSDDNSDVDYTYRPFEELHLPYGSEAVLRIKKNTGKYVILLYNAPDGVEYTYTLKKQN